MPPSSARYLFCTSLSGSMMSTVPGADAASALPLAGAAWLGCVAGCVPCCWDRSGCPSASGACWVGSVRLGRGLAVAGLVFWRLAGCDGGPGLGWLASGESMTWRFLPTAVDLKLKQDPAALGWLTCKIWEGLTHTYFGIDYQHIIVITLIESHLKRCMLAIRRLQSDSSVLHHKAHLS